MFHYQDYYGKRQSYDIKVGDFVQSRFRAQWKGTVKELHNDGTVSVTQILDKSGYPFRKHKTVRYHCHWFHVICRSIP